MAFSNKSVEEDFKYFWKPLFFNDCENHSGCPIGRLGASRTSSSGTWFAMKKETEKRSGDEPYYASNKGHATEPVILCISTQTDQEMGNSGNERHH